ncbi:MAG: hypothetical protein ACRD2L_11010, partial [Terriglobia bacterium]
GRNVRTVTTTPAGRKGCKMTANYLFRGRDMFTLVEYRKQQVTKAVNDLDSTYLLNANEDDLVKWLIDEYSLDVPVVKDDEIHVADHGETKVDVSHDYNRGISDRSRPFYIPGSKTTIAVPVEGDAEFFRISPNTFTTTLPVGEIVGSEIHLSYTTPSQDAEAIKREYQATVREIKQNLDWQRQTAEPFNNQLEALIRDGVTKRKKRILAGAGMVESLGLPIKRREGAPTTYAVPISRRRPRVERPKVTEQAFAPEPTLALEDYEHILSIMRNMVTVMELSPRAFAHMGEEDIRAQFLVQLNGQYEGGATAETFNFEGKTDILLRADGRNVFIAECKVWHGEKELLNAIDQLLSYLSWRDTKTALLIFNRNVNFTDVLKKVASVVPSHRCFKRAIDKLDESTFRYIFRQLNDPNRELVVTVMAFDIPK